MMKRKVMSNFGTQLVGRNSRRRTYRKPPKLLTSLVTTKRTRIKDYDDSLSLELLNPKSSGLLRLWSPHKVYYMRTYLGGLIDGCILCLVIC